MKFSQFMTNYKRKYFIQKIHKFRDLKLVPGPFVFAKNEALPLLKNGVFQASYLR